MAQGGGGIGSWFRGLFRGDVPPPPALNEETASLAQWHGREGEMRSATCACDVRVQGVPCKAGSMVTFHRNGRLSSATLALDWTCETESLSAGALVTFESNGKLRAWQQKLTSDREFRVRASDSEEVALPVTIPAGSNVCFEWGQLREVVLAAPVAFDGLAFPAKTELIFGDSGALSHVRCPSDAIELRGIRWERGTTVVFEFGKLREGYPAEDDTYEGVPYQVGEIVRLHDNGRLARCYLGEDARLSGVPCKAYRRIYLDDEGNLLEATVAEDCVLAGVPVAAGSTVGLDEGKPTLLEPREDCEVDGIPCARDKRIQLTVEGRLLCATLARAHAIDGWSLPAGTRVVLDQGRLRRLAVADATAPDGRDLRGMWRIELDAAGAIRRALPVTSDWLGDGITLREPATIDGLLAAAGSSVEIEDGRVTSLVLATDQQVGAWTAKAGTRVRFHDNGTPSNLYLADDTRISGVPCAAARTQVAVMNGVEHSYRENVILHPDGSLSWAKLADATNVAGVPLEEGETVSLRENGTLAVGTLAGRWRHPLGCIGRKGTTIGLFDDGSPSLITLDAPFSLDGTEHAAGTVLSFTAPGVLASTDDARVPLGPLEPIPLGAAAEDIPA